MAVKSVIEVLVLLSFVMGSLCYVYIIPGEMGKSKGDNKYEISALRLHNSDLNSIAQIINFHFCSDHENYCLYNDTQSLIKRGESMIMPTTCEEVSCGDDYTMQILG